MNTGDGFASSVSPALSFQVVAQSGRARMSIMTLPHQVCETPMFMPVGTQGTCHLASRVHITHCIYRNWTSVGMDLFVSYGSRIETPPAIADRQTYS